MCKAVIALLLGLWMAMPAFASQEGMLALGDFRVESPGIGESGPVVVSGIQNLKGFEKLEVKAFGKTFVLTQEQLSKLKGGLTNGIQISYEGGYDVLGGRTLYLRFTKGFTSGVVDSKLITISESGTITVTSEKTP